MLKKILTLVFGFCAGNIFIFGFIMSALGNHLYAAVDFIGSLIIMTALFWRIVNNKDR